MFDSLFKNKYSQAVIVFFAVVGLVSVLQNVQYYLTQKNTTVPMVIDENMPHVHDDTHAHPEMGEMMEVKETIDYSGTHIMPNGQVMTGAGVVIEGAVILENGDIQMPGGMMITPAMDMRP